MLLEECLYVGALPSLAVARPLESDVTLSFYHYFGVLCEPCEQRLRSFNLCTEILLVFVAILMDI